MPNTKVTPEQFKWDGKRLLHEPTGARFSWAYPKSESFDLHYNWGRAGDILGNGDDYSQEEVKRVAMEILMEKRS
jgi:hypothetical protein